MTEIKLDNSGRVTYQSCPRKYYLSIICDLKSEYGSAALRYGSVWHAYMQGYYGYIKEHGWSKDDEAMKYANAFAKKIWDEETRARIYQEDDYRTFENLTRAFVEYIVTFGADKDTVKIIDTEKVFQLPVKISDAERAYDYPNLLGKKLILTGKIDLQLEMSMLRWITDFKTTGQSLSMQTQRLNRSAQMLTYQFGAREVLDYRAEGCMVVFHQILSRRSKATNTWGKVTIDFARVPQIFTEEDIKNWRKSFLHTANSLAYSLGTGNWPMQFDSCYQYGTCTYNKICEANVPLGDCLEGDPPEGYIREHWSVTGE